MSWYITIRSNATYSQSIETTSLITFLSRIPTLQQTSPVTFESIALPWVQIIMAKCRPNGCYNSNWEYIPTINVIELICADDGNPADYEHLATQIAMFIGWEAWADSEERPILPKL
jgi:hypothetical protein